MNESPFSRFNHLQSQAQKKWAALQNSSQPLIYLGAASCGRAAGALLTLQAIQETLEEIHRSAQLLQVGCIGPCYLEPLMDLQLPGLPRISYANNLTVGTDHKLRQPMPYSELEVLSYPLSHWVQGWQWLQTQR